MPDRAREVVKEGESLVQKLSTSHSDKERLEKAIDMYEYEIGRCQEIFEDRNRIYKNTFEQLGLLGTTVTLIGDVFRLRNMIIHEPDHGRKYTEQIEDKLIDVVNQAVISLMMLRQENFEGK